MREAFAFHRRQEYQDLHNSSVAVMLREMQREVYMGRPFESRLILMTIPIITFLSFAQQVILTVASWLFSHGENHLDPEL